MGAGPPAWSEKLREPQLNPKGESAAAVGVQRWSSEILLRQAHLQACGIRPKNPRAAASVRCRRARADVRAKRGAEREYRPQFSSSAVARLCGHRVGK